MADAFPIRLEQGGTLGQVVRRVRVGREMDLRALSQASGVALGSLSEIENDKVDPRLTTLVKLAAGLRLPLYALIGHDCNSKPWLTAEEPALSPGRGAHHEHGAAAMSAFKCGECERTASSEKWDEAWGAERDRRLARWASQDPFNVDIYVHEFGLEDRMVCPGCGYVHSDDEASYVQPVDEPALSPLRSPEGGS